MILVATGVLHFVRSAGACALPSAGCTLYRFKSLMPVSLGPAHILVSLRHGIWRYWSIASRSDLALLRCGTVGLRFYSAT